MDKKSKKILYGIAISVQLIIILSTIINVVVCIISSENIVFFSSLYFLLVPNMKFAVSCNYLEIVSFIIILLITLYLFIRSSKEYFNFKLKKSIFIPFNTIWIIVSSIFSLVAYNLTNTDALNLCFENMVFYMIVSTFLTVTMVIKVFDVLKYKKLNEQSDYNLSDKFQMHAIDYEQVKRTVKLPIYLEMGAIIFSVCMKYCNNDANLLFIPSCIGIAIFSMISFIGIIYEFYRLKNKLKKEPPNNFLIKLNIAQIISFVLFAISFVLLIIF